MRFDTGPIDRLFGKKVVLEGADENGTFRRKVSAKWLEQMKQEGRVKEVPSITVLIANPTGNRQETWIVGDDMTQEQYDHFADKAKKEMYVLEVYRNGELESCFLTPAKWQELQKIMPFEY